MADKRGPAPLPAPAATALQTPNGRAPEAPPIPGSFTILMIGEAP